MRNEEGYAVMDAFLIGLILTVPLLWMLMVVSSLHRTALASTSAAREAGLVASRAAAAGDAHRGARAAISRSLSERGVDPDTSTMSLSWAPDRDAAVRVEIKIPVRVLTIPFLGRPVGPTIWVRANHVAHVDPYRSVDV